MKKISEFETTKIKINDFHVNVELLNLLINNFCCLVFEFALKQFHNLLSHELINKV